MRVSARAPIVVISPHLDDCVLGCWSVLNGQDGVTVINVFDGVPRPGFVALWDRLTGAAESHDAMEQRLVEDREALALAGHEAVGLSFPDVNYREPEGATAPTLEELRDALESAASRSSMLFAPAGIGGHPDHRLVNALAVSLAYDAIPVTLYAELPYAVEHGWPHWVTRDPRDPHMDVDALWETYLEEVPCARSALQVRVNELSEEDSDAKLAAMQTYRSQFPALNAGVIGRLANPAIRRYEVFWEVRLPGDLIRSQTWRSKVRRALTSRAPEPPSSERSATSRP